MSLLRSFVEDMFELQKHKTKLEYVKQINSNEILNTNNLSYIYKQCPRYWRIILICVQYDLLVRYVEIIFPYDLHCNMIDLESQHVSRKKHLHLTMHYILITFKITNGVNFLLSNGMNSTSRYNASRHWRQIINSVASWIALVRP